MKFHSCHYCDSSVSELGSYVQISNKLWAHLRCFEKTAFDLGVTAGRLAILKEQQETREELVQQAKSDAIRQYEAAPRCQKCGQKMLSERPQALPAAFSSVLGPGGTPGVCMPCVRAEAQARNAVRNTPTPQAPKKPEETSTLIPGGRPIEIE